jgi:hypothetical protein
MNMQYSIREVEKSNEINIEKFLREMAEQGDMISAKEELVGWVQEDDGLSSSMLALELGYSINYTIKSLSMIMDYYKLSRRKLCKQQMIQLIVLYELDNDNLDIVNKRKQLWGYIKELKEDEYFSKFILLDS